MPPHFSDQMYHPVSDGEDERDQEEQPPRDDRKQQQRRDDGAKKVKTVHVAAHASPPQQSGPCSARAASSSMITSCNAFIAASKEVNSWSLTVSPYSSTRTKVWLELASTLQDWTS